MPQRVSYEDLIIKSQKQNILEKFFSRSEPIGLLSLRMYSTQYQSNQRFILMRGDVQ